MPWIIVLLGAGAALPIIIVVALIMFRPTGASGPGGLVWAVCMGIALGAAGGLLISAVIVGLVLGLRAID